MPHVFIWLKYLGLYPTGVELEISEKLKFCCGNFDFVSNA